MDTRINNSMGMTRANDSTYTQKNKLDINDFLKIMAAEISNQSFMGGDSGGSKTDYISQLAQFTTLEQLSMISDNLNTLNFMGQQQYAFSLIGKTVTLSDGESTISGVVEKVKLNRGLAVIQVGGKDYYLGSVIEVGDKEEVDNEL